jgi:hypothetical protein
MGSRAAWSRSGRGRISRHQSSHDRLRNSHVPYADSRGGLSTGDTRQDNAEKEAAQAMFTYADRRPIRPGLRTTGSAS